MLKLIGRFSVDSMVILHIHSFVIYLLSTGTIVGDPEGMLLFSTKIINLIWELLKIDFS